MVTVEAVRPVQKDRPYTAHTTTMSARTEPVRGDITNQFGAVLMDHEGPYAVHVEVTGPLGRAVVDAMVDATYDLRPPPYMLVWYLVPFLLAGIALDAAAPSPPRRLAPPARRRRAATRLIESTLP